MQEDDDLQWYHLAICRGMTTNWFYDDYENDAVFAKTMDGICFSCPVRSRCLKWAVENEETGLWGGVYLNKGKADTARNSHKSDEDWEVIRGGI